LVKIFPKVTETFILGEILDLERRGLPLIVLSLRQPTDSVFHAATKLVRAPIVNVPSFAWPQSMRVAAAHLGVLIRNPFRYLRTAAFVMRRAEGHRLREFAQAGCLASIVQASGIGHLHAHFASEPVGVAELASRLSGITYSISAHAKDIYLTSRASLRRKMRAARFTVTCTEYNRRYLADLAGPDAAVMRVYHGIDLERFRAADPPADSPGKDSAPLVLSVGRLREKKGFALLIEACRRLRDDGVAIRCQIVGYGPERDRLRQLIADADLSDVVHLTGKRTHEQLIPLFRAAAMFVLPCQITADGDRDGVPNAMLEAMAMELPVICSDVSGIPEVVMHNENGLLVPPGDPKILADKIRMLIERPEERSRLGKAGRRTVSEMFCGDQNLEPVVQLLSALSSGRAAGISASGGIVKEFDYARGR
jgi:glycosyltransferase involved in cell wall biosynthesis